MMESLVEPVEMGFHTLRTTVLPTTAVTTTTTPARKSWRYTTLIQQFYALRTLTPKFTVRELMEYVMAHTDEVLHDGVLDTLRRLRKQKKLNYRVVNARRGEYEFLEVAHAEPTS